MNSSANRAEFARQLYNFRHMLESEEPDYTSRAIIQQLKNRIEQYNRQHPMNSYHTDTQKDSGSAGVVDATDCAGLGAHGYEVEPQAEVDEKGNVMMKFSNCANPFLLMRCADA